jgi:hypothetical protein
MTGNRLVALLVLTAPAYAQLTAEHSARANMSNGVYTASATFGAPVKAFPVVAGAPYSAQSFSQLTETLQGGQQITRTGFSMKIYRDAAGRSRMERFLSDAPPPALAPPNSKPQGPLLVEIDDPVVKVFYVLDLQRKVAHRGALPLSAGPPPAPSDAYDAMLVGVILAAPGQAVVTFQNLGPRIVQGVMAQGRLVTATWPVGARGNDRPLVATAEIWRSTDLKVTVLTKTSKPLVGEQVNQLSELTTNAPDPALLQPPSDYQVVDEPGTFTITYP